MWKEKKNKKKKTRHSFLFPLFVVFHSIFNFILRKTISDLYKLSHALVLGLEGTTLVIPRIGISNMKLWTVFFRQALHHRFHPLCMSQQEGNYMKQEKSLIVAKHRPYSALPSVPVYKNLTSSNNFLELSFGNSEIPEILGRSGVKNTDLS